MAAGPRPREFDRRKKKSEDRLRGSVGLVANGSVGGGSGRANSLAIRSAGERALPHPAAGASGPAGRLIQGPSDKASLADVQPMRVDGSTDWDKVGGLQGHVEALKEMVLMPLLYPEVFDRLGVAPPRGVLFHGPPGTGKTLVARALANTCSTAGRPVAFFMRKGADVLSKWVGEAEKQLRLLFEEAYRQQPSVIFFDEIDGLAPIRSSKQDQIHASIVSTLLALMDGLDSRGQARRHHTSATHPAWQPPRQPPRQPPWPVPRDHHASTTRPPPCPWQVILIGATNRIDSLDPALRRPGRFDRELQFALPSCKARFEILGIHTASWATKPTTAERHELARRTHGFCGADLRALCAEAALRALHGSFPEIFQSEEKYRRDHGVHLGEVY